MLDHGPIHQGHEKRNPWRQHVHRATRPRSYAIDKVWEAVTSRYLGNGRSDASYKQYGGVSASYKQFSVSASYKQYVSDEWTYNIQSRQKHNMLSLLHAACLKLLFFFLQNRDLWRTVMNTDLGLRKWHTALELVGCCERGNERSVPWKAGENSKLAAR